MKTIRTLAACLAIPCSLTAAPAPERPPSAGEVTLSLPEFRALAEAASKPPEPPPPEPAPIFESAEYSVDLRADGGLVKASWSVRNFSQKPSVVAVAPGNIRILPGSGASLVPRGNEIGVLCPKEGVHLASTEIAAAETSSGNGRTEHSFPFLPALSNILSVRGVGEGVRVSVRGAQALPSSGDERRFLLAREASVAEFSVETKIPAAAQKWEWRSDVCVEPGEAALRCRARLVAISLEGDGSSLRVPVPAAMRGVRARSEGLSSQTIEKEGGGDPSLLLAWETPYRGERIVDLEYELPAPAGASEWALVAPPPSGESARNFFVVARPASIEFSGSGEDPRETPVPDWIRKTLDGREAGLFAGGASVPLRIVRLPLAESEALVLRTIKYRTTVVRDGSLLTEAEAELESAGPSRWKFVLPEGSRLLRCEVGGAPARPAIRGGALELPIDGSEGGSRVRFSFTSNGGSFDPVAGTLPLKLPETGTFVRALEWRLAIPDSYEVAGIDTNAEIIPQKTAGDIVIGQQLLRGTPVVAEIFYRKRGIQ